MGIAKAGLAKYYAYIQLAIGLALWSAFALVGPSGTYSVTHSSFRSTWIGPVGVTALVTAVLILASWAAVIVKFGMGKTYFISFDMTFAIAALLLISPVAGAALALASSCVDIAYRAKRRETPLIGFLSTLADNVGNRLLRLGFAWAAYRLLGGALPPAFGDGAMGPALAAFAAYFLSNNLFYMPKDYLLGGDLRSYWRESFTSDLVHSFTICSLGFLLAGTAARLGFGPFALMSGFVLSASWVLSARTKTQDQLSRRIEDLTILSKVSGAASTGLDVEPIVNQFTLALAQSLPADGIGVIFYQRYTTSIHLVQVEGDKVRSIHLPEEKKFQYDQLPLSEPSERLGQRLFEFLQPLETAPFFIPPSVFGLPLVRGGEPFGGIVVHSYTAWAELKARQELLETCAQTLIVALDNCFLHMQAIHDPLTGLYNRSYFLYRLEEELSYSSRHRAPFALLMLDLDDFKAVNDRLGHSEGDRVLKRIGDLLRKATRREDVPSRYGGDEFILLLLGCGVSDALDKAERLRTLLSTRALPKEEAFGLTIGCSLSLLHSNELKGEQDVPSVLRKLDDALYEAKSRGKNQIVRVK